MDARPVEDRGRPSREGEYGCRTGRSSLFGIDPTQCETLVLLWGGAGAVAMGCGEGHAAPIDNLLGIDGAGARTIMIPASRSRSTTSALTAASREHYVKIDDRHVFRFASDFPRVVRQRVERNG